MSTVQIKQAPMPLPQARAAALDAVLSYLFLAENKEDWTWLALPDVTITRAVVSFNRVPLSHFDGADTSLLYESLHGTVSHKRQFINPESGSEAAELRSLPGPWNTTKAVFFADHQQIDGPHGPKPGYLFSLTRTRTVPLAAVRGLFRLRSSVVIERSQAHLYNDGTYFSDREYLQYFGGAWWCVGIPVELDPPQRMEWSGQGATQYGIELERSFALTAEYEWHVHIGFNVRSMPAVSLPSDPVSAKTVFKLRDVPPGKSRRDAIRHWVSGHVRQTMEPNYSETYIWPYLRGAEEFTWSGLYCKIEPSKYDLRKAAEYQAMAKSAGRRSQKAKG
jgi:hypothetical protein